MKTAGTPNLRESDDLVGTAVNEIGRQECSAPTLEDGELYGPNGIKLYRAGFSEIGHSLECVVEREREGGPKKDGLELSEKSDSALGLEEGKKGGEMRKKNVRNGQRDPLWGVSLSRNGKIKHGQGRTHPNLRFGASLFVIWIRMRGF